MSTTSSTHAPIRTLPELLVEMGSRSLETLTAVTRAQQRVTEEVVELLATGVKEGARAGIELQTAALEATTAAHAQAGRAGEADAPPRDLLDWYRSGLLAAAEGTQRVVALGETNARILGGTAERLQASVQRAATETQKATATCLGRLTELSTRG